MSQMAPDTVGTQVRKAAESSAIRSVCAGCNLRSAADLPALLSKSRAACTDPQQVLPQ